MNIETSADVSADTGSTRAPRLSIETLDGRGLGVGGLSINPAVLTVGIVHFGIGAFHRAHQAVFTEKAAAAAGDTRWGILGVTGRSDAVVRQLVPQDCLYGVLEKSADATRLTLIGSVRGVVWPQDDSQRVVATIAAATTHLATLTITEKGYLRSVDGGIDLSSAAVRHDLVLIADELGDRRHLPASQTPMGLLVRGLAARHRAGGAGFSVVSCDNLSGNGAIARELVFSLVDAIAADVDAVAGFRKWVETFVRFPSTMVDRITPATTDKDRDEAAGLLGLRDEGLVVAEPFSQWVIEDDFAGDRPAWELAGAIITHDVAPYENVKLRILNATHSLLAWLGALCGHATIAAAVGDERLRVIARRVIDDDIIPSLDAPLGLDLNAYRDEVLTRFANPNLAHTTAQVAMDGSQKLPNRVLGTVVDRLGAGATPDGLALVVAAWIGYIAASVEPGAAALDDPLASELHAAVGDSEALRDRPHDVIDRLFELQQIFPSAVVASRCFRAAVVRQLVIVRELAEQSPQS